MKPTVEEEIWFARIAVIFGAKELIDVATNLFTILKMHSGLPIVLPTAGTNDNVMLAYLITSGVVGIYLVSGGRLLSRVAYGQAVPRNLLLSDIRFPDGSGWLSIAFRAYGIHHLIGGILSVCLVIAHYRDAQPVVSAFSPRLSSVETAWALEHFVIGFTLLRLGGKFALFFLGEKMPPQPTEADGPRG